VAVSAAHEPLLWCVFYHYLLPCLTNYTLFLAGTLATCGACHCSGCIRSSSAPPRCRRRRPGCEAGASRPHV